jgi:dTMP kinase
LDVLFKQKRHVKGSGIDMSRLDMITNESNGFLITFCGLDGCGKTTIIHMLKEYLQNQNYDVLLTKQPTSFVRSSKIFRTYMDTPNHDEFDYRSLSLLAASDRVQHSNRVIAPALSEGKFVISDRYFYSCLANLRARGYTQDKWIYEIAKSIPKPDLAFFLDIDVDTAIKRVRSRAEERSRFIDIELQHKLRQQYLEIATLNEGILISSKENPDVTFQKVRSAVDSKILIPQKEYCYV